ncbi:MAG: STAS domain-containing protein [Ruminiclostridium sp.]|nr:STAS domain-containing protein [Ruminiclostridium sp.]
MEELKIEKKQENGVLTVIPEGRIDNSSAPQLEAQIKDSLEGITKLVLEFEKVTYISSSGLRVLLNFHKSMEERDGELIVRKPAELVKGVFDVTGFSDVLTMEN